MLPSHLEIKYQYNDELFNILLVHGSPRKINEYLFEERPENSMIRLMQEYDAHIMCFGHTHKPYHKTLKIDLEKGTKYLHAINIGSVGKPKDGDVRACYVVLEISKDATISKEDGIQVEFRRVEYDIEKTAKAIEESPLPNEFADMLRKAY